MNKATSNKQKQIDTKIAQCVTGLRQTLIFCRIIKFGFQIRDAFNYCKLIEPLSILSRKIATRQILKIILDLTF